jgi:hypothetical protein
MGLKSESASSNVASDMPRAIASFLNSTSQSDRSVCWLALDEEIKPHSINSVPKATLFKTVEKLAPKKELNRIMFLLEYKLKNQL